MMRLRLGQSESDIEDSLHTDQIESSTKTISSGVITNPSSPGYVPTPIPGASFNNTKSSTAAKPATDVLPYVVAGGLVLVGLVLIVNR